MNLNNCFCLKCRHAFICFISKNCQLHVHTLHTRNITSSLDKTWVQRGNCRQNTFNLYRPNLYKFWIRKSWLEGNTRRQCPHIIKRSWLKCRFTNHFKSWFKSRVLLFSLIIKKEGYLSMAELMINTLAFCRLYHLDGREVKCLFILFFFHKSVVMANFVKDGGINKIIN